MRGGGNFCDLFLATVTSDGAVAAGSGLLSLRRQGESPLAAKKKKKTKAEAEDGESGSGKIRCPRCGWRPRKSDRWQCVCDHVWNTFDTHGVCPGCKEAWDTTQCLACHQFSPHEDWYEKPAA